MYYGKPQQIKENAGAATSRAEHGKFTSFRRSPGCVLHCPGLRTANDVRSLSLSSKQFDHGSFSFHDIHLKCDDHFSFQVGVLSPNNELCPSLRLTRVVQENIDHRAHRTRKQTVPTFCRPHPPLFNFLSQELIVY